MLVNGLADDLETWGYQTPALLEAGFRVLSFDNRGVGESDKPAGPVHDELFAQDTKALVDSLGITDFHLIGVSMGGMIAQEYALAYPGDLRSLMLGCTYAAPGPFCSRMFAHVGGHGPGAGPPVRHAGRHAVGVHAAVLRAARPTSCRVRGGDGRRHDQPVDAYLAAALVDPDARRHRPARRDQRRRPSCSRARRTS